MENISGTFLHQIGAGVVFGTFLLTDSVVLPNKSLRCQFSIGHQTQGVFLPSRFHVGILNCFLSSCLPGPFRHQDNGSAFLCLFTFPHFGLTQFLPFPLFLWFNSCLFLLHMYVNWGQNGVTLVWLRAQISSLPLPSLPPAPPYNQAGRGKNPWSFRSTTLWRHFLQPRLLDSSGHRQWPRPWF